MEAGGASEERRGECGEAAARSGRGSEARGSSEKSGTERDGPGVAGNGPGVGGRDARGANGRPGPATRRAVDRSLGCQVSCHVVELVREQRPECWPSHMMDGWIGWMDGCKTSLQCVVGSNFIGFVFRAYSMGTWSRIVVP